MDQLQQKSQKGYAPKLEDAMAVPLRLGSTTATLEVEAAGKAEILRARKRQDYSGGVGGEDRNPADRDLHVPSTPTASTLWRIAIATGQVLCTVDR